MFEQKNIEQTLVSNPLLAQAYALEEFESRLGGNYAIADANSVFGFMMEYGASLQNIHAQKLIEVMRFLYPKRAQTMEDLLRHMSDFDYLNLYSTPCTCNIQLTLNRRFLIENAKSYNDNYKLVVIPKHTVFTIGRYKFGIHYPIQIRINKTTNTFLSTWDAEEDNPLYTLSQNIVTTLMEDYSGLELVHLQIPTQQFFRSIVKEDLIAKTGFIKTYKYNHKFWAVRIWTIRNGEYVELNQALTKDVYDTKTPTARLLVDTDESKFTVDIPQIYFTNGLMGKKLYMEVYSTLGALDDDISNISVEAVSATFNLNLTGTSDYSKVLKSMPTIDVIPLQTKLVGGGDGYDFEELRKRVINQNFYQTVPITPSDIVSYFSDNGFSVIKYLDNVTDRVYHAHRTLSDNNGDVLPTTNAYVNISSEAVDGVSTIIKNADGTFTILPSTLYLYSDAELTATPLKDAEVNKISQYTKLEKITEFNSNTYTYSPFHTHVINDDRYPQAISYNLNSCKATRLTFIESNDSVAAQIVVYGVTIVHSDNGTKGYKVELATSKSNDLASIDEEHIYIYVSTYTNEGHVAGTRATFDRIENGLYIYKFTIETDYWFNSNGQLNITNLTSANIVQPFMLNLEDKYYITCMVDKQYMDGNNDNFNYISDLEQALLDDYVVLLRQSVILHLGHSLKDVVSNDINITWSPIEYETWPVDVPLLYTETVYKRDVTGNLIYSIVDDKVVLEEEHQIGDPVLDEAGNPYYKHRQGNIRYDDFGDPIIKENRNVIYQVSMMQFDAKIQLSENPDHIVFRNTIYDTLETYFTVIRAIQDEIIERTNIYFRPTKTFGSCKYSLGNQIVQRYPLAMKFSVKYYIEAFVENDQTILDNIKEITINEINTQLTSKHICMMTIFENIRQKLSDYIVDIDLYGINDVTKLQTLVVAEDDAQPIVAHTLTLDRSDRILLEKDIIIEFVVADSSR